MSEQLQVTNAEAFLTPTEMTRLVEAERRVEHELAQIKQSFAVIGGLLREIRDERLYRATHPTFDAYLADRWNFSRSRAYRLIDAAQVARLVSPMGDIPNERQARELVPLLHDEQVLLDVLCELRAEYGERLTAEKIHTAVSERLAFDDTVCALKSSRSDEWYTPNPPDKPYLDAVREVLGAIDLDPASCAQANEDVAARRYYDIEADGLAHEWHGRVFLNPPYSRSGEFVAKLLVEYQAGRVEAAIVLLNAYGFDAAWFGPLWAHLLCFTDHRIAFANPLGASGSPTNGNVFVYLGPERARFANVFVRFGEIVERSALVERVPAA